MNKHLDVFIASNSGEPSFDPLDSDGIINAIHTEQVIGTLVRMHPSGRYEGYLAAEWKISEDFKVWTFKIKSGLSCEDGSPINGKTFSNSFNRIIKLIRKHSDMPLINRLEGYSDEESNSISGIQSPDSNTLRLVFSKPVTSGLLEYLALPYLGFYCDANFNQDGTWKSKNSLVSSSTYKIDMWSGNGPVKLKLRDDWFQSINNPPSSITIQILPMDKISAPSKRAFIFSFLLDQNEIPQNYQTINMLPSIFHGIVLSDNSNVWLKDVNNRRLLRDEIKRQQKNIQIPFSGAISANTLYPHMSLNSRIPPNKINRANFQIPLEPLKILAGKTPSKSSSYMLDLIIRSLNTLGIPYVVINAPQGQHNLMETFRDPTRYDIRPSSVDSGGGIENQLIKFMFCSKLGVSFLDPSKRICSLVEEFENQYGDVVPSDAMKRYVEKFDSIIEEDASLVPVMKTGHSWLLSKDLNRDFTSPTMGIPYFDLMNLNE